MKISKRQLRKIIKEEKAKLVEQGFHSMSPAGKALANSIKGKFMRMYPDAKVGIDGRGGFITVNGVKAIDMSQATGRRMSDDEMIEKMHAVYAETQVDADVPTADSRMDTFREGKMKITKRQLRRIIKEEKAVLEQSWRQNPAKIRLERRQRDRQRMIDTMTFEQLKRRAFDSALGIQGRLDTGQYEYADIWEVEIPRLADLIDAAKIKAAEEGVTYDDVPEVRHNGGLIDLSRYSLGLPGSMKENKTRITKRQLRRIIKEAMMGQGGIGVQTGAGDGPRMISVTWDTDGPGTPPPGEIELHQDAVADYNLIAATEGKEQADYEISEYLTDETGWLVLDWRWK